MMRTAVSGLLLLLAACGGTRAERPLQRSLSAERPLAELPQQELAVGQCGMVLWQRIEPARRIAWIIDEPATARIVGQGGVVSLARVSAEGDPMARHAPIQRFAGEGHRLTVDVRIEQREGLADGAIVSDGTLTWESASGTVVLPVFGLVGCR